jgi:hypothetical protein
VKYETNPSPYIYGVPHQADICPAIPDSKEGFVCSLLESIIASQTTQGGKL